MLRAAGISEAASLPVSAFRGSCCKMFFPMTETGGTTITDAIGGAVYTPSLIGFKTVNGSTAVRLRQETPIALTSGAFPSVLNKDFILFSAYHYYATDGTGAAQVRPEAVVELRAADGSSVRWFDGDGFAFLNAGGGYNVGTETLCGASPNTVSSADDIAGIAIIRNGSGAGIWIHNDTFPGPSNSIRNDYPAFGDVFMRGARQTGFTGTYVRTPEAVAANDYNIPAPYYYDYDNTPIYDGYLPGIGYVQGGYPGLWPKISYTGADFSLGAISGMSFGIFGAAASVEISHFGLALFVFKDGLPSDYKQALRWMRDQWVAGNKVIWPDWVSVA